MTRDEALAAVAAQGFVFPVREPRGDWSRGEGEVDESQDLTRLPSVTIDRPYFIVGIVATKLVQKDAAGNIIRETVSVTFNLIDSDGIPAQTSKSFLNRNLLAANKNGVKGSIAAMKAALLNKTLTFSRIERTKELDQFGNNIIEIDYSIQ